MISEVLLPEDRFVDKKLKDLKRKNFIYGKNGTGKTSITEMISNQYSESHNINIFQGFHRILEENGGLNAIALGKKNAELQPQIDLKKDEVEKLLRDISSPELENENSFTRLEKANKTYSELKEDIERFYSLAASNIKNSHTELTGANYNKRHFRLDIDSAITLNDHEIEKFQATIYQPTIKNKGKFSYKEPKIANFLEKVNEIILKNITQSALLSFETVEKMNWSKEGLSIHTDNDVCAFCGAKICQERLNDLNSYFNDEVKSLEERVQDISSAINVEKKLVGEFVLVDKKNFYPEFHARIDNLNLKIMELKDDYTKFLEYLLATLQKKNDNIFISLESIEVDIPEGFKEQIDLYNELYDENENYNNNLKQTKELAKERLRLNEVSKQLSSYKYTKKIEQLEKLQKDKNKAQEALDVQKSKLSIAQEELNDLLSQTVDESLAAENINKLLKNLGNHSFELTHIKTEEQKGQYQIKGYDGELRNIETLSTGEKNIVAFLWFMFNLENTVNKMNENVLIIFDDPMNSNDDTVQYLIISQLQELLKNSGNRQIFILTHSAHFYLNIRYKWWNGSKKASFDKATYHLIKYGKKSKIKLIYKEEDDIKSSYDALWSEVRWLYNENKPDLMLNPLRRIFETFQKFNGINDMYFQDSESQKLFNVNSHSIDDLEVDLNGKDKESLMKKVEMIFESVNANEHFKYYWKGNE